MSKPKICILTGAGISAESGLKTFRDSDGLWEGHDIMEVATPEGWRNNPGKVLQFYNQRRAQLKSAKPNKAHNSLALLESNFDVVVITQNVDDLHERAGSRNIVHLHGELTKSRSSDDPSLLYPYDEDIELGDLCEKGSQIRPHIVWFGEMVPELETAISEVSTADALIIIGTSLQVYPAASLIAYAPASADIFYIDPKPHISHELRSRKNLVVKEEAASTGVPELVNQLLNKKRHWPDGQCH